MTADAMFRIASQSKAITSTAILMLVEEGKIALGDPVSRFIPAYARDDGRVARRQRRAASCPRGGRSPSRTCSRTPRASRTAATALDRRISTPPRGWVARPATAGTPPTRPSPSARRWSGSRRCPSSRSPARRTSTGTTPTSSAASSSARRGCSLDEFIRTRITGPLGMTDTYFFVPAGEGAASRHAVHERQHGTHRASARRARADRATTSRDRGGASRAERASSRPRATMRASSQMMLNRGEIDGVRILSPRIGRRS